MQQRKTGLSSSSRQGISADVDQSDGYFVFSPDLLCIVDLGG
jgi:hypothetical protein